MKFRNPWIDPRVVRVRAESARAYLLGRSWRPLPEGQENLLAFEAPGSGEDKPVVVVPLREQARDYPQRVIEMITDLAVAEDRYAVDVLDDVLKQAPTPVVPDTGAAVPGAAPTKP
jgi:hypothetical protein